MLKLIRIVPIVLLLASCGNNSFLKQKYTKLHKIQHVEDEVVAEERETTEAEEVISQEEFTSTAIEERQSFQEEVTFTPTEIEAVESPENVISDEIISEDSEPQTEETELKKTPLEGESGSGLSSEGNKFVPFLLLGLGALAIGATIFLVEMFWHYNDRRIAGVSGTIGALLFAAASILFIAARPTEGVGRTTLKVWSIIKVGLAIINLLIALAIFASAGIGGFTYLFLGIAIFHFVGAALLYLGAIYSNT